MRVETKQSVRTAHIRSVCRGVGVVISPYSSDTETIVARIPPEEIGYVSALVESYEGIGIVRTRDPQMGIIEFWVIREFREVFDAVLESLRDEMEVEILKIPPAKRS